MNSSISFKGLPTGTRYISKNLIVGKRQGLFGLRKLQKEEGVNFIIDFSNKKNFPFPLIETLLCKILHLKHKLIPINLKNCSFPLGQALKKAKDTVLNNPKCKFFIHCRSGKHRSVLIAAAFEVIKKRIRTPEEFEEFLRKNKFYEIRHIRKFLIPFKPTAEERKVRIDRLNLQKKLFMDFLFGKK